MNLRFAPTSQAILGRDGRVDAHWERWFGDLARAVNAASGSADAEQAEPAAVSLVQGQGIAITGTGTQDSPWVVRLRDLRDSGTGDALVKITRDSYGRVAGTEEASASDLPYDNTDSGMVAEDVQAALDELADEKLDDAPSDGNIYGRRDGAWDLLGGGGGMSLLGEAAVEGSAASSLAISGLDLSGDGLYYVEFALENASGSTTNVSLTYNADTTATNYWTQFISGNNAVSGARQNSPVVTSMVAGGCVTSRCRIALDRDGLPVGIVDSVRGPADNVVVQTYGHYWTSSAAVTGITLVSSVASALAVGSTIRVYRVNTEALIADAITDGDTTHAPSGDAVYAGLAYAKDRANHTGTQLASTISDFAATVRSTLLTGLSTATNAVIAATDTVLQALGKLQAQVSANVLALAGKANLSGPNTFTGKQTIQTSGSPEVSLVSTGSGAALVSLDSQEMTLASLVYRTNGAYRWYFTKGSGAEAGGNVGSDFELRAHTDAGAFNFRALIVKRESGDFLFGRDNLQNLGGASNRAKEFFCGNATINTSDAREKTTPRHLSPPELAAALDIARLPCIFQWLAAIEEKGEAARLHASPTVQDVIAAMESHGLDPFRYGFVCYDEWDEQPEVTETEPAEYDDEGNLVREEQTIVVQEYRPAGNRYSLRPSELAHFIQAALVQEQDSIKARLAALEG